MNATSNLEILVNSLAELSNVKSKLKEVIENEKDAEIKILLEEHLQRTLDFYNCGIAALKEDKQTKINYLESLAEFTNDRKFQEDIIKQIRSSPHCSEEEVKSELTMIRNLNSITTYMNSIIKILKSNNIKKRPHEEVISTLKDKFPTLSEQTKREYDTLIKLTRYFSNIITKVKVLQQMVSYNTEYYTQLTYITKVYDALKRELIKPIKEKKVDPYKLMKLCKSIGKTVSSMKAEELVYIGSTEIKEFLTNTLSDIIANIQLIEVTTVEYLKTLRERMVD